MRRRGGRTAIAGAIAATIAYVFVPSASAGLDERVEAQLAAGAEVALHEETGRVTFAGADDGAPIADPGTSDPAVAATGFIRDHASAWGLGAGSTLEVESVLDDSVGSTVRLNQTYEGLPVIGGELVVTLDSSERVLSAAGELLPDAEVGVSPRIDETEAGAVAIASIAKAEQVDPATLGADAGELSILDQRILGGPGLQIPRLVWSVNVAAEDPASAIDYLVFVDAHLGSAVTEISQVAHALDRRICDDNQSNSNFPCVSPVRVEGDPPVGDVDVDTMYDYLGDTHTFFQTRFGQDSFDGAGAPLVVTVDGCTFFACPFGDAFFSFDEQAMFFGPDAISDDVVGHEFTHGFTDAYANLYLYYEGGALSESLSDTFGELIDLTNGAGTDTSFTRWKIGEDAPVFANARDMEDPENSEAFYGIASPDRMQSPNYFADPDQLDGGGVHINAGVGDKTVFLIADGQQFNGQDVSGIGLAKTAQVYQRVVTSHLFSGADYGNLYEALQQSCAELIGTHGITLADCGEVRDAVTATEMNLPPFSVEGPDAPVCDTGEPRNLFFDDIEDSASGKWTHAGTNVDSWFYPNPFSPYARSGEGSIWGWNASIANDASIEMTSSVALPAGAQLHFNHAYGFEDAGATYDGGVIEYSTDGGTTWTDAGSLFTEHGYTGTISNYTGTDNPLADRDAFVRESQGYTASRADLSSLVGKSVRFRFRIGTDGSIQDEGWYLDNVRVYTCSKPVEPAADPAPVETTIGGAKVKKAKGRARFEFSGSGGSGALTFSCSLDGSAFEACVAPARYADLRRGKHTFKVAATDAAGTADPTPAKQRFGVRPR